MIPAVTGSSAAATAKLPYQWVTANLSGALYTTTNTPAETVTWTSRTSSFGATAIYAIASNGSRYVAVGASGKLAVSDDGITWTQKTSSFGTSNILGVAYGNNEWVAIGSNKLAYSTDNGETWTQKTITNFSTSSTLIYVTGGGMNPAYANGYWVSPGAAGNIFYATTASGTWTEVTSANTTLGSGVPVALEYLPGASLWVIGADNATVGALATATAPNSTWTARDTPVALANNVTALCAAQSFYAVFTSTGSSPPDFNVQSSTNGTTWTDRTPPDVTTGCYQPAVAVDNSNRMWAIVNTTTDTSCYSTDGATWTGTTAAPANGISCLAHSSGRIPIR